MANEHDESGRPAPLLRKAANAMFRDVEAALRPVQFAGDVYEQLMGGSWVGGWMELTPTAVTFAPNGLNKLVIRNDERLVIDLPLESIRSVEIVGGVLTKIISLRTADGEAKLRCWGAPAVAEQIRRTAGLTGS